MSDYFGPETHCEIHGTTRGRECFRCAEPPPRVKTQAECMEALQKAQERERFADAEIVDPLRAGDVRAAKDAALSKAACLEELARALDIKETAVRAAQERIAARARKAAEVARLTAELAEADE